MDILVLATMKNAAKCDKQCELQNSVNHRNFERNLRSRDTPGSILVSVSLTILIKQLFRELALWRVSSHACLMHVA